MSKNKLFAIIFATSLFIILISLVLIISLTPSTKKNSLENIDLTDDIPFSITTNFILKTTSNEYLNSDTLRGKFILIYFGSTHCPHTCLPNLIKMKTILTLLKKQYSNNLIGFIFITADPINDTPEHLKNYFNKLESKIIPLTGEKKQIDTVLKNFKTYKILFKNNQLNNKDSSKSTTCIIESSSPFYLIDQTGRLIKEYNAYGGSLNIAKDISHYIKVS